MIKIEPYVADILGKYLPDNIDKKEAIWHHKQSNQWIARHRTLEIIAASCGIEFEPPQIIESNVAKRICVICVIGKMKDFIKDNNNQSIGANDRQEWSIGEASPENCRNQYPAAMAEKRAKDRVILKLLGLHGYVYSDQEINTTDEQEDNFHRGAWDDFFERLKKKLEDGKTEVAMNDLLDDKALKCIKKLTPDQQEEIEEIKKMITEGAYGG